RTKIKNYNPQAPYYVQFYPNKCPSCECSLLIGEVCVLLQPKGWEYASDPFVAFPQFRNTRQVPPEVPNDLAKLYRQSSLILDDSPEASAALSRRVLQTVLRGHLKVKERDLATEIRKAGEQNLFPSSLTPLLHALRECGNFGAHPMKM